MSIPTVAVTCIAYDQNGNPVIGGLFRARLDRTETYNGFVVPEQVTGTADANGIAVLQLWPNALGVAGSSYRITAINPDTRQQYLNTTVVVPNSACNLHEIIVAAPFPPVDASEQALIAAQGALALVTAQAGIATNAATEAEGHADDAQDSATAAQGFADDASNSFTDFDKRYLGTKASDPIVDNEGNALQIGALYYRLETGLRIYDGAIWSAAYISEAGTLTNSDIGITVQAYSENLDDFAAKTAPAGEIVGTTDIQTLTNKSISGTNNTLTNIANSSLVNSAVTVNGQTVALGASTTVTATATNSLTIGTGLNGSSYNGSAPVTISINNTVATLTGTQTLTNKTINLANNTLQATSVQLAAAVTDETGTGALVFATNPTLVTPALGTPSSATLTNATGLPISTGVSGLGSGVATFLATPSSANLAAAVTGETGTGALVFATSPTLVTPALGTPSSATLTNATGLPVATGISGLGSGVATFLATPSSANLRTAVTDETGTGALVFATSPTLVTPALGTPASGVVTNLTGTASININGTVGATTPNTGNFTVLTENASPVVVQTDIGSAPNEIPLNQYLGSMAYLNADNIAFSATGTNTAAQNLAVNKLTTVTISADTTLTTTVPLVGSTAYVIVISSGATTRTVTFGTGFKSTGTLATGTDADRRFVFQFISDGTNLVEVSRTAAITY
jgi:hypothetical protein